MELRYRPEIDGLRTVAVLLVIAFHAEIFIGDDQLFKGGFFGVDVFFVISGFLITSIFISEYRRSGNFSVTAFYERRARRLLPALLAVIAVSLPFAWNYLLPSQLVDFSRSVLSSLVFGSNIYWDLSLQEYGAQSARMKPFLHTWSLAVEEQFYLVFPLLFVFLYRRFERRLPVVLCVMALSGLLYAQWMTTRDASFSFYMLTSRFWQLLAGSMLAVLSVTRGERRIGNPFYLIMPCIGLSMIVLTGFYVDDSYAHPGFVTLVPVVGAGLLIWFADEREPVTRLLSSRLFVGLGLVSYSLYLWHYPVFVFGRIMDPGYDWRDQVRWSALVLVLSVLTYYLLEKPFRNRARVSARSFLTVAAVGVVAIGGVSFDWLDRHGNPERLPKIVQQLYGYVGESEFEPEEFKALFGAPSRFAAVFLVGDSHMGALRAAFKSVTGGMAHAYAFTTAGCPYAPGMERYSVKKMSSDDTCGPDVQAERRATLLGYRNSLVIAGGRLPLYLSGTTFDNLEGGVDGGDKSASTYDYVLKNAAQPFKTVDLARDDFKNAFRSGLLELAEHGHTVVLVYPIPEVGWDVPGKLVNEIKRLEPDKVAAYLEESPLTVSYDVFSKRTKESFALLDSIRHRNIHRVYPHRIFCEPQSGGRCATHDAEHIFYKDSNHVSGKGAQLILNEIALVLGEAAISGNAAGDSSPVPEHEKGNAE